MNWINAPLSTVLEDDFDGAWGKKTPGNNAVTVLRSTDMRGGRLSFSKPARCLIPERVVEKRRLRDGDVLVNKSSGSAHLVGLSALFLSPDDQPYLCSNFIRCLRPNKELIHPDFLSYILQSSEFRSQAFDAQNTTSGLRNIKMGEYKKCIITFPDHLEEQRRIVARIRECMDRVEEMEELRNRALKEAQVLAEQSFGRVLEGNGFPLKPVGELVENTRNGRSIKPTSENPSGFVLGLGAVRGVILNNSALKPIVLPVGIKDKYAICKGDVYVSRANTRELVGLSSFAGEDFPNCIFPDLLIQLQPKLSEIHPLYLTFALRTPVAREQVKAVASGTSQSMVKISGKKLKEIRVPVPSLAKQIDLLEKLKAVQEGLDEILLGMVHNDFSILRDAILRKAFAGEL